MPRPSQILATLLICGAILAGWILTALVLGQSPLATQRSSQLLSVGAIDGNVFVSHEWWRLVVSQFLHVHGLHMLFNAGCILILGACIELRRGAVTLSGSYFLGGTAGQLASVMAYPTLVSSGASQALMSLCAAALFVPSKSTRGVAVAIVLIQSSLDVYVSGAIKMGHAIGFVAGLAIALVLLVADRRRARPNGAV